MKNKVITIVLVAVVATLAFSCSKETGQVDTVRNITFTADDFILSDEGLPATKTSLVGNTTSFVWSAADTAGVFPSTGGQVYFTMESGAGANSAPFNGGGWGLLSSEDYYSYYPFVGDIYLDRNKIPVSYLGQKQVGASSSDHIGQCDFMYSKGELSGQSLSFNYHHMSCIIRAKVTLPAGTYTKLAVTAPTKVFVTKGWFDLMATTPTIVGETYFTQLGIDLESFESDGTTPIYVYIVSAPLEIQGMDITFSALNSERKEFQCHKTPAGYQGAGYGAGTMYSPTCSTWTEVPQSMGLILEEWGEGGRISGTAD